MKGKITLAMLLLASSAFAQKTSVLTPEKSNDYGIVYMLPKTGLRINLSATKTAVTPGDFYNYATRYIGTGDVISEAEESWVVNDVSVSSYGFADTDQKYLLQLKAGQPLTVCVDDDGMLLAINADAEAQEYVAPVRNSTASTRPDPKAYLQYVTGDFLTSQSSAKKAQMLSESLIEIRESRLALTRGTADNMPTDGKQLELMLNSLKDQEDAIMRAFTGVSETLDIEQSFNFVPTGASRKVLCRIADNGIVDANDLSGEPVYIEISDIETVTIPVEEGKETKQPKDGVVYAIPGSANVAISFKGDVLWTGRFDIAQFGSIFSLSPSIFTDKKAPQYAIFNPVTGALEETGPKE